MSKGIHPRIKMRWRNIQRVLDSFPKNKTAITAKEIYLDLEKRGKPLNFRTVRSILNQLLDEEQIVITKRAIQDSKKSVSFYKRYDCVHCREREREAQWDMENHRLARDDPEQFEIEYQKVRAAVLALEAKDG